jgi:hypothetical protein
MDILNWIYLRTNRLIKTKANNPKTDLVALGADVTFARRGDSYQTYAMTLADAVHAGCVENNTLKTGIFDDFPFPVTPVMLPTCTRVEDTPAFPTFLAVNLQGYKVSGAIELFGSDSYSEYLGSVEIPTTGVPLFFPWKTTGTVTALDDLDNIITNPFGLFNSVADSAGGLTYAQITIAALPYATPGAQGLDLVMFVDPTSLSPVVGNIEATVAFEFEFLVDETITPTFTIYV